MNTRKILLLFVLQLYFFPLYAATYYVSSAGNDNNTGTSITKPWATIDKVNKTKFTSGDRILFAGGSTFHGSLYFSENSKGTQANPIQVGSYGNGRATIRSETKAGLYAYNTAGYKISNLNFIGSGRTTNTSYGIFFYMDLTAARLEYVVVDSVEVQGYKITGIVMGSWNKASGYDNVSVTNSIVHDIGDTGIGTFAEALNSHKNVYIGNNKVYNISGLPEKTNSHSGSGIVLGGANGAVIEYCEAYNSGWLNAWKNGGPVGIWGYMCNNLIIQYNESHHNRTGTSKDGGGFDIDGGCTNSIMQYNYSHDNEGAGYLIAQYNGAPPLNGVIIRFNISENDGRKNGYGGIHLWSSGANGGIQNVEIYNNTIYSAPSASTMPKGAIHVESAGMRNINFRNNIIQTTGGVPLLYTAISDGVRFEGNNYWSSGGKFLIIAQNTTYQSLAAWRHTGQEQIKGKTSGYSMNPELEDPGKGITLSNPRKLSSLTGYQLRNTSFLIEKGVNLAQQFALNPGKTDFYGNQLSQFNAMSIGAHQTSSVDLLLGEPNGLEAALDFQVEVFPNPAKNHLEVRLPENIRSFKVNVYDITGRLVLTKEETGNYTRFDVTSLIFGVYSLHIETPKGIGYRKIVINK
jgi:hypothetical protein